jgi:hypothetical protein
LYVPLAGSKLTTIDTNSSPTTIALNELVMLTDQASLL